MNKNLLKIVMLTILGGAMVGTSFAMETNKPGTTPNNIINQPTTQQPQQPQPTINLNKEEKKNEIEKKAEEINNNKEEENNNIINNNKEEEINLNNNKEEENNNIINNNKNVPSFTNNPEENNIPKEKNKKTKTPTNKHKQKKKINKLEKENDEKFELIKKTETTKKNESIKVVTEPSKGFFIATEIGGGTGFMLSAATMATIAATVVAQFAVNYKLLGKGFDKVKALGLLKACGFIPGENNTVTVQPVSEIKNPLFRLVRHMVDSIINVETSAHNSSFNIFKPSRYQDVWLTGEALTFVAALIFFVICSSVMIWNCVSYSKGKKAYNQFLAMQKASKEEETENTDEE